MNNQQLRGGGVVFDPRNLKKKSVVLTKDGQIIEVKTPQEREKLLTTNKIIPSKK